MKRRTSLFTCLIAAAVLGLSPGLASAGEHLYRVTLTNVTPGQYLTPALVFSHHRKTMPFFATGQPASADLEQLAEGGNTMPLLNTLVATGALTDHVSVGGLIAPGESASVELMAHERDRIGLGAMMLPTNDGFVAAFGLGLPKGHHRVSQTLAAMDAGTEVNDESCTSIPGPPPCGGEPVSVAGGEGYVHVHGGIHGIGDLMPSGSDWRNPVARVTVERIRH